MNRSAEPPLIIGVAEYADLPEWRIARIRAKIDTGARTSALHVDQIRELPSGKVRFDVRLSRNQQERRVTVEARIARRGLVRSSNGHLDERIFVNVLLRLGGVERKIEVSLVDRGRMIYRMLIGRRALAHAFLIDPSRRYVLPQPVTRKAAPVAPPRPTSKLPASGRGRDRQRT